MESLKESHTNYFSYVCPIGMIQPEEVQDFAGLYYYDDILDELTDADWVITGEGSFDHQSLMGKVISGICRAAKKTNTKVVVIAGQVSVRESEYKKHGILSAIACKKEDMSLDYAMKNSESLLLEATREFANKYLKET